MKRLAIALALAVALTAASVQSVAGTRSEAPSIAQDIVSAGRLRLQSQRLAKLWLQIGLRLNADAARQQLAKGSAQFDASLAELERYARHPKTRHALGRAGDLWSELKVVLLLPYGPETLPRVNFLADDLMLATGNLALRIEQEAESPVGRLLDLSLRQNMLAQRLAKLYLLAQAGDTSRGRRVDMEQARKEFTAALGELSAARENSPASREALELAKLQWIFFDAALGELERGETGRPQNVATTSERIMDALDAVSAQYARDADGPAGATEARRPD